MYNTLKQRLELKKTDCGYPFSAKLVKSVPLLTISILKDQGDIKMHGETTTFE